MLTIYRFPELYRLAMRIGYGGDYAARYALIGARVTRPADVLELCCGDLTLHRHLRHRGVLRSYVGLESSPAMLRLARRRGVDVRAFDVSTGRELPPAGTVIMQASLYQFHDIADSLLPRLWAATGRLLVIAEPVRNLSQSRHGLIRWAGRVLSRTEDREHIFRYTEATLLELYRRCQVPVTSLDRTPGGRELITCSVKAPASS